MAKPKKVPPRNAALQTLGTSIRTARQQRSLTQTELAENLDLSVAYVSLIERGGRNPPYMTVVAIAKALGRSVSSLVE